LSLIADGKRSPPEPAGETDNRHRKAAMKNVYTVIFAAGMSTRLGFNKLTVTVDGEAAISRSVRPFVRPEIEKVFVVTAPGAQAVREKLRGMPVEFIDNASFEEGMAASARVALPYLGEAGRVFFHLGDKPFVSATLVKTMLETWETTGASIIVPLWEGKKGHPVLLDVARYGDEIGRIRGDRGLREVIEKHYADVLWLKGDEGCVLDIDTVEQIDMLRKRGYRIEKD
jgi:molybdenum cofactor cytidylyltransferase